MERVLPTAIAVTWDVVDTAEIKGYRVFYSMKPDVDMSLWSHVDTGVVSKADIETLEPHTVYAVRVAMRDDQDRVGELSDTVSTNDVIQGRSHDLS